jgi:23S rRNA (uridine2552-2'-O)-methyltransferase
VTKRSKSSSRWLDRQRRDPFVRRAAEEKLGSRAHFKLADLDRRFRLVRRDGVVLELGAAPGGWTRYLAGRARRVVALDRLAMEVPAGVEFAQVDVHAEDFDRTLDALLAGDGVDLVLSDMAPNISGVRVADQAASMELVELATLIARERLNPGGHLVVKMFQGEGVDAWLRDVRTSFEKVVLAKPEASRKDSREVYGVAMRFTGSAREVAGEGHV